MSAHHDPIDKLEVVLVWAPVVALCLARWLVPIAGPTGFLMACAGWSNLVAVVAIVRELKGKGIGRKRTIAFVPALVLFPLILAWDLTHLVKQHPEVYVNMIAIGFFAAAVCVIPLKMNGKLSDPWRIVLSLGVFTAMIGFISQRAHGWEDSLSAWALTELGGPESVRNETIKRFHVWTHLIGIPLIYFGTDGVQCFFSKPGSGDRRKYWSFFFYDSIMLALGGAFATAGWYVSTAHDPVVVKNIVGAEDVAAAAILILWNIAYVHLYSPRPVPREPRRRKRGADSGNGHEQSGASAVSS